MIWDGKRARRVDYRKQGATLRDGGGRVYHFYDDLGGGVQVYDSGDIDGGVIIPAPPRFPFLLLFDAAIFVGVEDPSQLEGTDDAEEGDDSSELSDSTVDGDTEEGETSAVSDSDAELHADAASDDGSDGSDDASDGGSDDGGSDGGSDDGSDGGSKDGDSDVALEPDAAYARIDDESDGSPD